MTTNAPASNHRPPTPQTQVDGGDSSTDTVLAVQAKSRRRADRYLVAADAPATVRAYTADWKHFSLWCARRRPRPMPAAPEVVGDYLSDLGEGYAKSTLRRKVAAIARANRPAGKPLDTRHPAIRDVLRVIAAPPAARQSRRRR